ncbi:MAG: ATP-binding cassette domain-containing protein [Acidimicrobiales bacterium]
MHETTGVDSAISAIGLHRDFGDVQAVRGVDLEIPTGEIYGFLGPNGAGKSTCVRMLCTLLTPTKGSATVAGFDVMNESEDVRLRIGVALQEAALDNRQTGRELLALQARLYGLTSGDVERQVDRAVDFLNLGDAIDRMLATYSGGMKRRLDLAAALIHRPEVLFLDEPTTGLDPPSRKAVWDEVRRLNTEDGVTIFLTTQYLDEADALSHRVGIISDGKLVTEGEPEALKSSVGDDVIVVTVSGDAQVAHDAVERLEGVSDVDVVGQEVAIGVVDGAALVSPVSVSLRDAGVSVASLTLRRPSLDDVFAHFTGHHIQQERS